MTSFFHAGYDLTESFSGDMRELRCGGNRRAGPPLCSATLTPVVVAIGNAWMGGCSSQLQRARDDFHVRHEQALPLISALEAAAVAAGPSPATDAPSGNKEGWLFIQRRNKRASGLGLGLGWTGPFLFDSLLAPLAGLSR